jgi:hypothetical protein
MTWNLFLDDERMPADVTWAPWQVQEMYRNEEWVVVRSVSSASRMIISRCSMPKFISFDHDLGVNQLTGNVLAKRLINDALDFPDEPHMQFPADFAFYVHSKNLIGKANIEGLLNNYLEFRK